MSGSVWDLRCADWSYPPEAGGCCSSSPLKEDSISASYSSSSISSSWWQTTTPYLWSCASDHYREIRQEWRKLRKHLCRYLLRRSPTQTHTNLGHGFSLVVLPVPSQVLLSPLHDSALNSSVYQVTSQHATAAQKTRQVELPSEFPGPDPELKTGLRTYRRSVTSLQSWASEKEKCHYL